MAFYHGRGCGRRSTRAIDVNASRTRVRDKILSNVPFFPKRTLDVPNLVRHAELMLRETSTTLPKVLSTCSDTRLVSIRPHQLMIFHKQAFPVFHLLFDLSSCQDIPSFNGCSIRPTR